MPKPLFPPGPQRTLLPTLHARALDTARLHPLLNDTHAASTLAKLTPPHSPSPLNTGMTLPLSTGICLRSLALDAWTSAFIHQHLNVNEAVTVVHLACGLDARCFRVGHGEGVRWVDVDLPEVVALRREVMPLPKGDYSLVVGSATDLEGWLDRVPADRPTVVVMEGLTMYLTEEEGRGLVEGVVRRFGGCGGEVVCDVFGRGAVEKHGEVAAVREAGAVWRWGVNEGRELEGWGEGTGLRLVEEKGVMEGQGVEGGGVEEWEWDWRMLRYRF